MNNSGISIDAMALVIEKEDGVYFIVTPPIGDGKHITLEEAKQVFALKNFTPLADEHLLKLIHSKDGAEYKISDAVSTELFKISDEDFNESESDEMDIHIEISSDQLKAYITFFPSDEPEDQLVRRIMKSLEDAGVRYGIRYDNMNKWLKSREPVEGGVVAEGAPPEDGVDAHIEFQFRPDVKKTPELLEDGRVDHHQLNLIQGIKKGELLAEIIPATPGRPGVTVTGRYLTHHSGKDEISIVAGKDVSVSEDKLKFYAACDGHIIWEINILSVYPIYSVKHDVDYSTGNIEYSGNVVVNGNVRTGFKIFAEGDIEIFGGVEGSHIVSEKGSVWIHKGVQGVDRCFIKAEKDVASRFIERAEVIAFRDIYADEDILHSNISAGRSIDLRAGTGQVIGGVLRAQKEIHVRRAGSESATRTELRIEHIKAQTYREEISKINSNVLSTQTDINRIKDYITSLQKSLKHDYPEIYNRLKQTYNYLINQFYILRKRKKQLEKRLLSVHSGIISVEETVYPEVLIVIGHRQMWIDKLMKVACFVPDGPDIRIT